MQLFHRNSYKMSVSDSGFTRRGGLVRPASKSYRFSHHPLRVPEAWHTDFAACGQRSGLLVLNLANIFEKLLDQKTFICLRLISCNRFKNNLLRKWGLLAHTSAAFLKNCCTEKLFSCLRLVFYSLFLFHKHRKSGCSISTGFQKLVEGTSALLFYFFRMLLLTLMQELLVNPQICI